MEEVGRMQNNLLLIRRSVGWTAEVLGDHIGVTRQTINNIENGRNKLTKTQYIAIRSVLDAEIARCTDETEMLATILDVNVDNPDKFSKKDRQELLDKANLVTPSILAGTATRKAVSNEWMKAARIVGAAVDGPMFVPGGIVAGTASVWLLKILSKSNKGKKK